jgi:predicted ArsR family transcriptional regulator
MLDQLLKLLRSGGSHRVSDLAEALDTTPQLVETMLEDLARMGYLRAVNAGCEDSCATCPVAGLCAAGGEAGRMWALTGKGAARQPAGGEDR